jgi:predicted acylesterase/phospholipase RssA
VSTEKRRYNILCLSGGGYRGLFTAALLRNIQRGYRLNELASHFDLIIGTSTGGLVASGLACGLSAEVIAKAFETHGSKIFPARSKFHRLYRQLMFQPQYDARQTRAVVKDLLGEKAELEIEKLDGTLALVAVSTVNERHRVFCSKPFADQGIAPTLVVDAILATSAAPTYFAEHKIPLDCLIDGGLAANAPVLVGISLLRLRLSLPAEKIHVLQIGTAGSARSQSFNQDDQQGSGARGWWFRAMKSTRDLVHLTLGAQEALAGDIARAWIEDRYVCVDAPERYRQDKELMSLDNPSAAATKKLKWLAEQTWREWQDEPALRSFFQSTPPAMLSEDLSDNRHRQKVATLASVDASAAALRIWGLGGNLRGHK